MIMRITCGSNVLMFRLEIFIVSETVELCIVHTINSR